MKATLRKEIDKLSLEDLVELSEETSKLITEKQEEAKSDLKAKMEELASASGMTVEEILGIKQDEDGRKGKRKSPKPKYYNPEDPAQTWSGRGRMPLWLRGIAEDQGVDLEDEEQKKSFLQEHLIEPADTE